MHTSFVSKDDPTSTQEDSGHRLNEGLSASSSATSAASSVQDDPHAVHFAPTDRHDSAHPTESSPDRAISSPSHINAEAHTVEVARSRHRDRLDGRRQLSASDLLPSDTSSVGLPDLNPPARKTSFFGLGRSGAGGLFSRKESIKPAPPAKPFPPAVELDRKDPDVVPAEKVEGSKPRVARIAAEKPVPRPWDAVQTLPDAPFSPFIVVPPTTSSGEVPTTTSSPAPSSSQHILHVPPRPPVMPASFTTTPPVASTSTRPSGAPASSATDGTSFSYTFDPQRFPLPDYPCLRAALLPIAVLATHVHKRSQLPHETRGSGQEPSFSNLFGISRGDSGAPWKQRVLVLTSFTATTTTLEADGSSTAAPEKSTYGCLHLFKNDGSGGVEIGRMPLSKGLAVSIVDSATPDGIRMDGGRTSTLSISAGEASLPLQGKKGLVREGGVRGKHERELGIEGRWVVQMLDEATLRAWVIEIKSLLLIQRAETMGLGDAARAQKSAGIPFDSDLDIALAKLTYNHEVTPPPSSTALSLDHAPASSPAPPESASTRPSPASSVHAASHLKTDPTSTSSSRSASPAGQSSLPKLSISTGGPSHASRHPRKSSVGSAIRSRFGREAAPSTITSPILTSSSNPLVSHLTRNDPLAGIQAEGGDPETSFKQLEAFLKTEHGMSASSRARMEDGTHSRPGTPTPPREECTTSPEFQPMPVKPRDFVHESLPTSAEDCHVGETEPSSDPPRRGSDDPHPFSAYHPDAIVEDPEDKDRPITFRSRSGGTSSKRDSASSDASQRAITTTPASDEGGPSSYFNSSGYLNEFMLERKPSVGSSASSQRTSSTNRSRLSHLPPPRPPPTTALPPTPLTSDIPRPARPDPSDPTNSPEIQKLRAENARLRAELALASENARLRAELDAIRRSGSQLTPPTSSSSGQTSPTSPTFSHHDTTRRSTLRATPPGPPPSGLPPPPPTATTLAPPPASRKGRRGSEPILRVAGSGGAMASDVRRPSLGLETLPELTISPPSHGVGSFGGTESLAGYRPVSFKPTGLSRLPRHEPASPLPTSS